MKWEQYRAICGITGYLWYTEDPRDKILDL